MNRDMRSRRPEEKFAFRVVFGGFILGLLTGGVAGGAGFIGAMFVIKMICGH